ncbi:hypothetical protein TNCV_1734661 [Trichonephila clavipes]|nr:hypothetical protein TNCV_1734661 [Trichonephila clavipes]
MAVYIQGMLKKLKRRKMRVMSSSSSSADLSSFRVLGPKDLQASLALADRNLLIENLFKFSLTGPLGTQPKRSGDKQALPSAGPLFRLGILGTCLSRGQEIGGRKREKIKITAYVPPPSLSPISGLFTCDEVKKHH